MIKRRSRRPRQFTVTRGTLTITSQVSLADANRELNQRIDWLLENTGVWIEKRWNLMIIIHADYDGFRYRVFDPAELKTGLQSNYCRQDTSVMLGLTEVWRVIDYARSHAAQCAWHEKVDDQIHIERSGLTPGTEFHRDLTRWIAFQREYLRQKSLGRSDNDSWRLAGGDPSYKETAA